MKYAVLGAAALSVWAGRAVADELVGEDSGLQIHGFASQGALLSTDNNYLAKTERGSLEFAEAGIALYKQLDPKLRVGFQLFTRDLGPLGNYSAKFDWFVLDYRWRDWLGLRAGRTKLPFGLYNEIRDIDAAQPVVLLPQSVYSLTSRDFLLAQTGVELYGYRRIGELGALDYRVYGGSIFLELQRSPGLDVVEIDVPWVGGGRLMWETPVDGLRLGISALAGRVEGDFLQLDQRIQLGLTQVNWLASLEYVRHDVSLAAEYGRGRTTSTLDNASLRLSETEVTGEFGYVMAGYRLSSRLVPTAYYSLTYPNVEEREGKTQRQHDAALCLRFDLTPHWLLKVEGHNLRGAAAVSTTLNPDGLSNRWWLFAAKTTVYF